MNAKNQQVLDRVPDVDELYIELGSMAGAIYGNRVFTYLRVPALGQREIFVVANGRVIEHYFTNSMGGSRRESEYVTGSWAWRIGLKKYGCVLLRSQSLASWYEEIKSAAEISQTVQQS